MGVHGLWRLIDPSGKPVPLETLENKTLAVDVSIWLHQAVKGFQDSKGAPVPNAHLLGLYHRICKLLYFRVKPVFVFDGGVPALKKQTIAKRNQQKSKTINKVDQIRSQLLDSLLKHSAITKVLSEKAKAQITSPTKKPSTSKTDENDLYFLPPNQDSTPSSSNDEEESNTTADSTHHHRKHWDLHSIDTKSNHFKSLPVDVRHEILTDLKETRKQSSWGRINELPTESDDFSIFQMKRLLKRQSVQSALEEAEKEMGGHSLSLGELEKLLKDQGVITSSVGNRIASDENTRFVLIKDVKQAIEAAKKKSELPSNEEIPECNSSTSTKDEELKDDLNEESECGPSTSTKDEELKDDLNEESECGLSTSTKDEELKNNLNEESKCGPSTSMKDEELKHNLKEEKECGPSTSTESIQLLLKGVKQALEAAKKQTNLPSIEEILESGLATSTVKKGKEFKYDLKEEGECGPSTSAALKNKADQEFENDLNKAIALSLQEEPLISTENQANENSDDESDTRSFINDVDSESEEEAEEQTNKFSSVQGYMLEYSGLTPNEIAKIIARKNPNVKIHESKSKIIGSTFKNSQISATKSQPAISVKTLEDEVVSSTDNKQEEMAIDISDSSSGGDDFLEVDEVISNKNELMEVVIKPDELIEDDLFSDIFAEKEKANDEICEIMETKEAETGEISNQNKENFIAKKAEESKSPETTEPSSSHEIEKSPNKSYSLKNNVQRMINEYSKIEASRSSPTISVEQMQDMKDTLQREQEELTVEKSSTERLAGNITDQMYQEAQELLELFGVPYLIAPMEAEAQCAFLDEINLTDGTITEDSDIWLFGGRTVYKNFFNQGKTVMEFKAENIQHHFKLSREQMILLALLVGSDYTMGITGIGPVTALEVLAAFPPKSTEITLSNMQLVSGLQEFFKWFQKGRQPGMGRNSLRAKLKNVTFHDHFPSLNVVQAYLEPKVETSKENFSWSKPDIRALIAFAKDKFGWTKVKAEEILNPVIKRLDEKRSQSSIKDYFKTEFKVDSDELETRMSKRVRTAVNKIGKPETEQGDEDEPKPKRKRNSKKKRYAKEIDEEIEILKKTKEKSKRRVEEIAEEAQIELSKQQQEEKVKKMPNFHRKEVIPQKQRDKSDMMRSKLKAIEVFRKSKQGPGYVRKKTITKRVPKEDADLSESD